MTRINPAHSPATSSSGGALSLGARGAAVSNLQRLLAQAGFSPGAADGSFGPKTRAALIAFQHARGLSADGVCGPRTMGALQRSHAAPAGGSSSAGQPTLKAGARGAAVSQLQRALAAHGLNPGSVDGSFGPMTHNAVVRFQQSRGLSADGVVGPKTWAALGGNSFSPGPTGGGRPTGVGSPAPGGSRAEQILNTARQYIGLHEVGNNQNPFSTALGRPPEAWCADFVSFAAKKAGLSLNTASAQGVQDFLQRHGTWKGKHNPQPGDALTFNWSGSGGWADHVGIVEKVYSRNGQIYVDTIEGNSSDQVRRKTYPMNSSVIKGFGTIV